MEDSYVEGNWRDDNTTKKSDSSRSRDDSKDRSSDDFGDRVPSYKRGGRVKRTGKSRKASKAADYRGGGKVKRTGLAVVNRGEKVIPAKRVRRYKAAMREAGRKSGGRS